MSSNALFIHFASYLWLYTRDRVARKWALTFLIPVILIFKDKLMWTKATKVQNNSPFPALFRVLPSRTSHERYLQIAWQIGHDNWGTSRIKRRSEDGGGAISVKWCARIYKTDIAFEITLHLVGVVRSHARSMEKETREPGHVCACSLACSRKVPGTYSRNGPRVENGYLGYLRYGKTGNKDIQLDLQHSCKKESNSNVARFATHESNLSCNKPVCCRLREVFAESRE